jgi:hypothetical protein
MKVKGKRKTVVTKHYQRLAKKWWPLRNKDKLIRSALRNAISELKRLRDQSEYTELAGDGYVDDPRAWRKPVKKAKKAKAAK